MKTTCLSTLVVTLLVASGGCGGSAFDPYEEPPYDPSQWQDDPEPPTTQPGGDEPAPPPGAQEDPVEPAPGEIPEEAVPGEWPPATLPGPTVLLGDPSLIERELLEDGRTLVTLPSGDSFEETGREVSEAEIELSSERLTRVGGFPPTIVLPLPNDDEDDETVRVRLPERFVMAAIPRRSPGLLYPTLEVRVSPNGTDWSAPSYPLTLDDCRTPVPVDWNIAPGLATNGSEYVVAAYGIDGTLWYSKSPDGVAWTRAVPAPFTEPELSSESRPSVVYDYDEGVWYALAVLDIGTTHVVDLLDLDGRTTAFSRVRMTNLRSFRAPDIAHTGIEGSRYVVSYSTGTDTAFRFYDEIPYGSSTNNAPAVAQGLDFSTRGATAVSSSLGQVFAATSTSIVPGFAQGVNRIWELDPSTGDWSPFFMIGSNQVAVAPDHEGPALAGVRTNMVVASPGPRGSADVWHVEEDSIGVLRASGQVVDARTIKPLGLAFGPKDGQLDDTCTNSTLQTVYLRFRSFVRSQPPQVGDFDATEDIRLSIKHRTRTGFVERDVTLASLPDVTKNQPHDFNENDRTRDLPAIYLLMQPDEYVTVTIESDGEPTTVDITYDDLVTSATGGNAKIDHTRREDGSIAYQLRYDASATAAQ